MHKGKILIADDDESIRFTLDTIFKDDGYITTTTKDGKNAKELIVQEKFDVIITDIKMPEIDGVELLKWIKDTYPQISVIMITGYASLDSSIDSLRAGADDYIVKPFDVDYLKIQVQGCIEKKKLCLKAKAPLSKKQLSKTPPAEDPFSILYNNYNKLIKEIQTSLKGLLEEKKDLNQKKIQLAINKILNTIEESKTIPLPNPPPINGGGKGGGVTVHNPNNLTSNKHK